MSAEQGNREFTSVFPPHSSFAKKRKIANVSNMVEVRGGVLAVFSGQDSEKHNGASGVYIIKQEAGCPEGLVTIVREYYIFNRGRVEVKEVVNSAPVFRGRGVRLIDRALSYGPSSTQESCSYGKRGRIGSVTDSRGRHHFVLKFTRAQPTIKREPVVEKIAKAS